MSKHTISKEFKGLSDYEAIKLAKREYPTYTIDDKDELFEEDKNCLHITRGCMAGGIECVRCGGWFCY